MVFSLFLIESLSILQISKLVLDEYFGSSEFMTGVEAGAEFSFANSSTSSVTTPTSAIPLSHQLNSASSLVDSGVDLNVMGRYGVANQASVDNEDEVFIVEKNGITFIFGIGVFLCIASSQNAFSFFLQKRHFFNTKFIQICIYSFRCHVKYRYNETNVRSDQWVDTIASQPFLTRRHPLRLAEGECQ